MQCVQSVVDYGGTVYIVVATRNIDGTSTLNLWLGGTDVVKEDDFVWTDGTHLLLNASRVWLPGNPDNLYNEDCQHIFTAAVYRLNDVRCDFLMPYISARSICNLACCCGGQYSRSGLLVLE